MNYCTYFDRGFLLQGIVLWRSLLRQDSQAILWVLALDDYTLMALEKLGESGLRAIALSEIERFDSELAAAKGNRSRIEFFFTLSPCLPRWFLLQHPEIDRVTYLDADLYFFSSPAPIFAAMDQVAADVIITEHRFPLWLAHFERHGRFNVGILSFRNSPKGLAVLQDWRERCLNWCYDRIEAGKYADQKYLDEWPDRFGTSVHVLCHPGVNLGPWNWAGHEYKLVLWPDYSDGATMDRGAKAVFVDDRPLVLFHFAGLRLIRGRCWISGQINYAVMGKSLRNAIYEPYFKALDDAEKTLVSLELSSGSAGRRSPLGIKRWLIALIFGAMWLRGSKSIHALGGGPWSKRSGAYLAWWRREKRHA